MRDRERGSGKDREDENQELKKIKAGREVWLVLKVCSKTFIQK